MAKRDKRIAAMRRNPRNVRPDDLDVVLRAAGFTMRQQGTSHKVYTHGPHQLVIPQRHPFLLQDYVKDALDLLDRLNLQGG
jgi:hypothetical protein